jgi:hypothetical protein
MLNISILGGGPSVSNYSRKELSAFLSKTYTIAINHAFKYFPHDMIMAQDYSLIGGEAEAIINDPAPFLCRKWFNTELISKFKDNFLILDNAKARRPLTGILAIDLAASWLKFIGCPGHIYLFGFDNKTNGHFHSKYTIPESALKLEHYAALKDAPCINMCADSAIEQWPKQTQFPEIMATTQAEKDDFFLQAKTWLRQNKYLQEDI